MFLKYEVDWYCDKQITSKGFVQARNFAEAAMKIEADYNNVDAIRMEWIADGNNCLDYDNIVGCFENDKQGARSRIFEAIKEGLKE